MFVNFSMHSILLLIFITTNLLAEEKMFVQEYTYQASEHDNKVTAKSHALEHVKILLLEEASVFFINELNWTKGEALIDDRYISNDFYAQNIKSIISEITEIKIIYQFWNTKTYLLKGTIRLDTDDIEKKIKNIIVKEQPLVEIGEVRENENGSESDTSETSKLPKINYVAYDIAPKPILPIIPIYPEQAKKNGIEGTIFVQYFIDIKGKVTEAWVIKGIPNSGLDESALSAVRNSSWEPALQGEMKVGIWQTVPVKFEL